MKYSAAGVWLVLAVWLGGDVGGDEIRPELLKQGIIERLREFESVECQFMNYFNTNYEKPFPDRITYAYKDGWIRYTREPVLENPKDALLLKVDRLVGETNVNGAVDRIFLGQDGRITFHKNAPEFSFMAYNALSPLSILGRSSAFSYFSHKETLLDLLEANGDCIYEESAPFARLYIYPQPADGDYEDLDVLHGVILHLDADRNIRQIDYVIRPLCSSDEIAVFARKNPSERVYKLICTDYFDSLVIVDGFSFPTKVKRVVWAVDEAKIEDLEAVQRDVVLRQRNEIGKCEYLVRRYESFAAYIEESVRSIEIDPGSIRINSAQLGKDDFVLEPENADTYWDLKTNDYKDEQGWSNLDDLPTAEEALAEALASRRRPNWLLLGSTALFLGSSSLLISVLVVKRRSQK